MRDFFVRFVRRQLSGTAGMSVKSARMLVVYCRISAIDIRRRDGNLRYFPMQNREKISPSKSSGETSPVMAVSAR